MAQTGGYVQNLKLNKNDAKVGITSFLCKIKPEHTLFRIGSGCFIIDLGLHIQSFVNPYFFTFSIKIFPRGSLEHISRDRDWARETAITCDAQIPLQLLINLLQLRV